MFQREWKEEGDGLRGRIPTVGLSLCDITEGLRHSLGNGAFWTLTTFEKTLTFHFLCFYEVDLSTAEHRWMLEHSSVSNLKQRCRHCDPGEHLREARRD